MSSKNESDHRTRDLLMVQIRDRPGISFGRLMRSLDLNEGTLRYHLNYLERKEVIKSRKEGRRRVYFVTHLNMNDGVNPELHREHKRVLTMIRRAPGIKPKEIMRETGLTRRKLDSIITKLQREHLIWSVENGNGVGYEIITRERIVEEMLLDLVERFLKGEIDRSSFMRIKQWLEDERENN